jgi:prepilin peptidase CpaA
MNLFAVAPLWLVVVLGVALMAGAVEDAVRLRISNATPIAVMVAAAVSMAGTGPSMLLWQNFALFALVLVLGTLAFSAGLLGGGDVKLLAAVSLWADLRTGLLLIGAILLGGGVVALCYVFAGILRGRGMKSSRQRRIPYGLAIAAGALLVVGLARQEQQRPEQPLRVALAEAQLSG